MSYDVAIIGGGINGTATARDLSGRGLSVVLFEKDDLAEGTSSRSTKLIHGGLRYLETHEFKLVRESLAERARLMQIAPHLIMPMKFILPHVPALRPRWMIRAGLFLYDHLAPRGGLPASKGERLSGGPLQELYRYGFSYADCWADDARLVVVNAVDAQARGAHILTRTSVTSAVPEGAYWRIEAGGKEYAARLLINAAGPWAERVMRDIVPAVPAAPKLTLSRGSHIVVSRLHPGAESYLLQQPDGRIVFALPYEENFTLIGTTDAIADTPDNPVCGPDERAYLISASNAFFKTQISENDVRHAYAGVRPLLDDGSKRLSRVTRDYRILENRLAGLTVLTLVGGKLTTFRAVAEHLSDKACTALGRERKRWTARAVLPGGDIISLEALTAEAFSKYPGLSQPMLRRYARSYGRRMYDILARDSGRHFGDDVYETEIDYLVREEWARSAEDILWRRSKLGLHVSARTRAAIEGYFA